MCSVGRIEEELGRYVEYVAYKVFMLSIKHEAGSEDSSPMLTSDPTSDSSDTGGSGKSNDEPNSGDKGWDTCAPSANDIRNGQPFQHTGIDAQITCNNINNEIQGFNKVRRIVYLHYNEINHF